MRGAGGDALFGPGFVSALIAGCRAALACPHRFAQTGGGWVLRECLVARPAETAAALRAAGPGMSREGMRYALEKCGDAGLRRELMDLAGSGARAGGGDSDAGSGAEDGLENGGGGGGGGGENMDAAGGGADSAGSTVPATAGARRGRRLRASGGAE